VPPPATIAWLRDPNAPTVEIEERDVELAARELGRHVLSLNAQSPREIDAAFATIIQSRAGALLIGSGPLFNNRRRQLAALAALTGFTLGEFSMGGKILEVLKEAAPQVNRVAVILNLEQPPHVAMWRSIEATAPLFGVRLTPADMQGPTEIEHTIEAFAREPNGGLIVLPGPISIAHRDLITALAARHRLPAAYGFRFFVTS